MPPFQAIRQSLLQEAMRTAGRNAIEPRVAVPAGCGSGRRCFRASFAWYFRIRGIQRSRYGPTSPGQREHFLVVASPERLMEFEAEVSALPRPEKGHTTPYPRLPESVMERPRDVGGFRVEAPREQAPPTRPSSLVASLGSRPETVQGVWVR